MANKILKHIDDSALDHYTLPEEFDSQFGDLFKELEDKFEGYDSSILEGMFLGCLEMHYTLQALYFMRPDLVASLFCSLISQVIKNKANIGSSGKTSEELEFERALASATIKTDKMC